jgi:hypothetical protein
VPHRHQGFQGSAAPTSAQLRPFLKYTATKRTAGIVLALTCAGIASLGFLDPKAGLGIQLGLAIPFGALALLFLYVAMMPASKHAVIVMLNQRAGDVVWVYPHALEVNGRASQKFVSFGLVLPQATVGFSPELRAAFKADPGSLRRS